MTLSQFTGCAGRAALLAHGASRDQGGNDTAPTTEAAKDAAGKATIASGLGDATKFEAAAKAAGLDGTLGGPGPYTVLVPSDAAFDKLPAGALDTLMKPEGRADLTALLSHHILPGTILAADIGKAIDAGGGKALIATMGGGTLTASRDGDKIIFADEAGTRAVVGSADQKRSNGVIHQIDSVLMPTK